MDTVEGTNDTNVLKEIVSTDNPTGNAFSYKTMFENYGMEGVLTLIVLVALIDFVRRLATRAADKVPLGFSKLFKRDSNAEKLKTLKNHLLFRDIENNLSVNIGNLHYTCEIRRRVFTDALKIRMECMRDSIINLIEEPWYFDQTPEEFANNWGQIENNIIACWHKRCEDEGIFPFVISKLDSVYTPNVNIINSLFDSVCRDSSAGFDIIKKTDNIFDILKAIHYSLIINTLEDTIAIINGDFSGKTYKNVECPGTELCTIEECPAKKH
jgi:hypothetical protein